MKRGGFFLLHGFRDPRKDLNQLAGASREKYFALQWMISFERGW